jgi:hypothetical protein
VNNKSKFNVKPGSFRIDSGDFINLGSGGYWWTFEKNDFILNWSTSSIEKTMDYLAVILFDV